MNLSALNTGLATAPVNNTPEVNAPGHAPARLPAGTLSGEDFAAFLRNQVRALKNSQRPDIAAAPAASRLPVQERPAAAAPEHDDEAANNTHSNKTKTKVNDDGTADKEVQRHSRLKDEAKDTADTSTTTLLQDAGQADPDNSTPTEASLSADATTATAKNVVLSDNTDASNQAQLTTIPLSPSINIITVAEKAPDDKSLTDFALAMGLDPSQVQALFGPSASNNAPTSNVSTQQMLAMNSLPTVAAPALPLDLTTATQVPEQGLSNVAVSTADFQALKADAPVASDALNTTDANLGNALKTLDILNMQVATGQAAPMTAAATPVSTLAVLSMMDTQLRAEDIDALKNEFDSVTALDNHVSADHALTPGGTHTSNSSNANASSKAAAAFVNNPNMAETFDKLSQKLATELAGRMHEKLNAGEWKMKFALKPASLGLVDVQLEMRDGKLTAQFNADTNLTQDLIQNGSQRLKEALGQLGMNNASVLVGQGQTQQQGQPSTPANPVRQGDDNSAKLADESVTETVAPVRPRHSNSLQFDNYA